MPESQNLLACTVCERGRGRLRSSLLRRSAGVELGGRLFSPMIPSGHGPTGRDGRGTCICGRTCSCCQHRTSPRADAVAADRTNLDEHDLQARGSLFLHRRLPSCGLSLLWALPPCAAMRTMHLFGQDDKQLPGSPREPGIGLGKMRVSLFKRCQRLFSSSMTAAWARVNLNGAPCHLDV